MVDVADQHFTFLSGCLADTEVVLGDARLSLEREPPQRFDLLVLDAFSSDSIPAHLLTREALQIYQRHLTTDGVIAIHISNRNLELDPVVARLANDSRLDCVRVLSRADRATATFYANWMLLTRNQQFLHKPAIAALAHTPRFVTDRAPLWTDQFNNLFQILRVY